MKTLRPILALAALLALPLAARADGPQAPAASPGQALPPAGRPLTKAEMVEILRGIDIRVRSSGDYKALVYLESREKDKPDVAQEALVYRRDADQKLMILFTKPATEAGKGYLRIDKNLWYYDPTVGKWERRTDRERIAGTDSRREDFDQSDLANQYNPVFVGEEKLGAYGVWHLKLTVKDGIDVAYPIVEFWIDEATGNDLKRQDFALSGRLLRTSLVPKWQKLYSDDKKADLWYRQEIHIYDEIDKANSTLVVIKSVDLHSLDENMFTKAWLESKSR
ncbi:MAG TPA: outer membrane lipoprotein-sorting protein [bacterium]|nr:outer membrane lipoprotein-sorting protein [bacterium]HXC63934.1 outer membrane lipoprotein-sorting protein [bacterium]